MTEYKSYLFSRSTGKSKGLARNYLTNLVAFPDKDSEFDKKIGKAKYALRVPVIGGIIGRLIISKMLKSGIDSMIFENNEGIAAHCAFQKHDDHQVHVFSYGVSPNYRESNLATRVNNDMIATMSDQGYSWFKIGNGGHSSNIPIKNEILAQNPNYSDQQGTWIMTPARR
jgi:hypothetical protein